MSGTEKSKAARAAHRHTAVGWSNKGAASIPQRRSLASNTPERQCGRCDASVWSVGGTLAVCQSPSWSLVSEILQPEIRSESLTHLIWPFFVWFFWLHQRGCNTPPLPATAPPPPSTDAKFPASDSLSFLSAIFYFYQQPSVCVCFQIYILLTAHTRVLCVSPLCVGRYENDCVYYQYLCPYLRNKIMVNWQLGQ